MCPNICESTIDKKYYESIDTDSTVRADFFFTKCRKYFFFFFFAQQKLQGQRKNNNLKRAILFLFQFWKN